MQQPERRCKLRPHPSRLEDSHWRSGDARVLARKTLSGERIGTQVLQLLIHRRDTELPRLCRQNASSVRVALDRGCPSGCLFDVRRDPEERHDRKLEEPAVFASMLARLGVLEETVWSSNVSRSTPYTDCLNTTEYRRVWEGFRGPACFRPGEAPTKPPRPRGFARAEPQG